MRHYFKSAVSDSVTYSDLYDPEKLFFYTDTNTKLNSNTDTWPKQLGVDYGYVNSDALKPSNPDAAASSAAGDTKNFKADEEPWTQPLLGAFTYHLQPASLAANITAGISKNAIGAALRTVTIMRGLDASAILSQTNPTHTTQAKALQIVDHVSNVLRPVISVIPSNATPADLISQWDNLKAQATGRVNAVTNALNDFQTSVPTKATQLCQTLTAQVTNQFNFLTAQIENEIAGLLSGVFEFLVPASAPTVFTDFQNSWKSLYSSAQGELRYTSSEIRVLAASLQSAVDPIFDEATGKLTNLSSQFDKLIADAVTDTGDAIQDVQVAAGLMDGILGSSDGLIAGILNPLTGGKLDQVRQSISDLRNSAAAAAQSAIVDLTTGAGSAVDAIRAAQQQTNAFNAEITATKATVDLSIANLSAAATTLVSTSLEQTLAAINTKLLGATDWNGFRTAAATELGQISTGLQATVQTHMAELKALLNSYASLVCGQILQSDLTAVLGGVQKLLNPAAVEQFFDNLKQSIAGGVIQSGADAAAAVEDYLHGLEASTTSFIDAVLPELTVPALPSGTTDAAMFLLRGFGDVPTVPQLNFGEVQFSAFRFAGLDTGQGLPIQLPQVNLTPLVGWVNNVGDAVNAIAIGLPTSNLADALVPFKLSQFDLSSFLPNIGGLDLTNLFPGLRMPSDLLSDTTLGQYVSVTHGEDPQSRSAWVNLAMSFEIDDAEMFSYFGVTLTLDTAVFKADAKVSAQAGQPVTRAMSGSILGDWSLSVGGFDVVILEQCTLRFDQSGHFGFDVSPDKVKLQGILDFLAEIISDFFSGDGFTTTVTGAGVQTLLDLPLPDIQSGTFGIANLRLLARFGIAFPPKFQIQFGLGLATLEQPFTLTVFILGGAGYLALTATYSPDTNSIDAIFNIGIFASASLAISLGPVSGGIYAYFGITVAYEVATGRTPNLQIGLILMFCGQVTLLGFLSVSLELALSGTYDSTTHVLTGTGTVSYSIQIGPFFSIDVNSSVSYAYSNDPLHAALQGASVDPAPYDAAAAEYLAMFYN